MATFQYDDDNEMIDRIIELIRADDTANSETIEGMVQRLRELNALGTAQIFSRKINTGNGLTGGGDLSEDRTISLAEGVVKSLESADNSVSSENLAEVLKKYLTIQKAETDYAKKSDARQAYVIPFTYGGTINGETTSPQIRLPRSCVLTEISAAVDKAAAAVNVTLTGGVAGSVTIPAGQTSAVSESLSATVSGPLRVNIKSSSAEGTTVLLRFREV